MELDVIKMERCPLRTSKPGKVIAFVNGVCEEISASEVVNYNYNTINTKFFHNWEEDNLPPWLSYKIKINRECSVAKGMNDIIEGLKPGATLKEFSESIDKMLEEVDREEWMKNLRNLRREKEWLARGNFSSDVTLEEFILKTRISFRREPENKNKKTFDFVEMEVSIPSSWSKEQCKTFMNSKKKEFIRECVKRLRENKRYQKFEVPVNFLKISNIVLRSKLGIVDLLFELKR